jgi:hypothetical protein
MAAALLLCGKAAYGEFEARTLPGGGEYFADKIVITNERGAPAYTVGEARFGNARSGVISVDELCRRHSVMRIEPFYPGKVKNPELKREIERLYVFTLASGNDALDALADFTADPNIESAEIQPVPKACYTPNDPDIGLQWYLEKVDAYEAWDIVRGDTTRRSVIGIVDTGVNWDHNDLAANIWINAAEDVNGNGIFDNGDNDGIDADSNGYVDDVVGWDMGQNDNNPRENAPTHGTPVAGCASEATDNDIGGAGIGFSARIMCVKGSDAQGNLNAVYQGMIYAADNGAHIVNCSWGSPIYSQSNQDIIRSINNMGVLVVASAGSSDTVRIYPGAYEGVIAVGATDQNDHLSSFSGYGSWIDVCAPGVAIRAPWDRASYVSVSGTSFSAPMVCGLAALIRAWRPYLTIGQVETLIVSTAVNIDSLNPSLPDSLVPPRIDCDGWLALVSSEEPDAPARFLLAQNYPNPFNAGTTIRYVLLDRGDVKIDIFNIAGQRVATLGEGIREAGTHALRWDASGMPSGIYFYRLRAAGSSASRAMILLK